MRQTLTMCHTMGIDEYLASRVVALHLMLMLDVGSYLRN